MNVGTSEEIGTVFNDSKQTGTIPAMAHSPEVLRNDQLHAAPVVRANLHFRSISPLGTHAEHSPQDGLQ